MKRGPLVFLTMDKAIKFAANEKLSGRIKQYKIIPNIYVDKITPGYTPGFAVIGRCAKSGEMFMYRESRTDAGIKAHV